MPNFYRPTIDVDVANLSDWGVRFDRRPPDYTWSGPYDPYPGELTPLLNYMFFVRGMEQDFFPDPAWEPTPVFWGVWVRRATDAPIPADPIEPSPIYTGLAESVGLHA